MDKSVILITSAGNKIPLYKAVLDAANRIDSSLEVLLGDSSNDVVSRHIGAPFWLMPRLDQLDLGWLVGELKKRQIKAIIPTRDAELLFWSSAKALLRNEGIKVAVSDFHAVQLCLDKLHFSRIAAFEDVLIPCSTNLEDMPPGCKLVVKERFGSGSTNILLNATKAEALEFSATLESPIFQPFETGAEVSIDAWCSADHQLHGLNLRHRNMVKHGESAVTTTFRDEMLEQQAAIFLEHLRLSGSVVLQGFIELEKFRIIEVNPRFGGASTASLGVGLDLMYWTLFEIFRSDEQIPVFKRTKAELKQVRVSFDEVFYDPHF